MQLTRQADYAVRVVLDLSGDPTRQSRITDISRRQRIPPAFLRKIVQILARTGLIHTVRGADGGVRLARDPAAITLRQVIEAVEGPMRLNRCLIRPRECPLDQICPMHPVWRHIQDVVVRELDAVNFAQFRAARLAGSNQTPREDGVHRRYSNE